MKLQHCVLAAVVLALQGRSVTGQGDCDAPPTCPGDEVVCNNGFVVGDPATPCAVACDGQCCVGVGACSGFTGTVCMDGSCGSPFSCRNANIDLVVNSCNGMLSCDAIGGESDAPAFLANSCNGTLACTNAGIRGTLEQITDSCSGYSACARIAQNGKVPEIVDSCIGEVACWEVASSEDGDVGGIGGSCQGARACWGAARDDDIFGIFECCGGAPDSGGEDVAAVGVCEGAGVLDEGEARQLPDDCRGVFPTCAPTNSPTLSAGPSAVPAPMGICAPIRDDGGLECDRDGDFDECATPGAGGCGADEECYDKMLCPAFNFNQENQDMFGQCELSPGTGVACQDHTTYCTAAGMSSECGTERMCYSATLCDDAQPGICAPAQTGDGLECSVDAPWQYCSATNMDTNECLDGHVCYDKLLCPEFNTPNDAGFEATCEVSVDAGLQCDDFTTYCTSPGNSLSECGERECYASALCDDTESGICAPVYQEGGLECADTPYQYCSVTNSQANECLGGEVCYDKMLCPVFNTDEFNAGEYVGTCEVSAGAGLQCAAFTTYCERPVPQMFSVCGDERRCLDAALCDDTLPGICAPSRDAGGLACPAAAAPWHYCSSADETQGECLDGHVCYDKFLCPAFNTEDFNDPLDGGYDFVCEVAAGAELDCDGFDTYCTAAGMDSECGTARMCYDATLCDPSDAPSLAHSDAPSLAHSAAPSLAHSNAPSLAHSAAPSLAHSNAPSLAHSAAPSVAHSAAPSRLRRVIISTNITIATPGPFVPDSAVDCERIVEEQFRLPVETRLMADLDMSADELGVTVTSVDDIAPPCAAFEVTRRALVARALQGPTITTFTYEIRPLAAMTDETAEVVEANLRTDVAASLSLETLQDLLDTEEVEEVFGGQVIVGRVDTDIGLDGDDPIIETASPTSGAPTPAPSVSAGFCAPIRANGGLECDIGTFVVCATPGASGCGADEECYDKMLCPAFNQGNEDMFGQCELSPGGGGTACEDHTTYCTAAGMSSECGTARMCYDATLCDSVAPTYSPTAFPTLPVVPPPPAPPTAPTPPGPDSPGICAPPIAAGGLECMPKPTPDWAYCTAPGGQAECDSGHTCYNKLLCPEFNSDSFNAGGYEAVCELSAGAGPECTAFTTYCEVPGSECGNGRVCHDALLCNAGQPGICAPAPNDDGLECSFKPDPDWAYCSTPNSRSQCHSLGASYTCYPKRLCPEFVPDGNSGYPGVCGLYFQSDLRGLDCPEVTTMCAEVGSESNCASGGLCFDATLCNDRIGSHAGFCAVPVMAGGGRVLHPSNDNGYDCDLIFSPASRTTWCDEPGEGGQCPVGEMCLDAEMCAHSSNPKSGKSKTKSSKTKTGKGSKSAKGTSKSNKSSKGAKRV